MSLALRPTEIPSSRTVSRSAAFATPASVHLASGFGMSRFMLPAARGSAARRSASPPMRGAILCEYLGRMISRSASQPHGSRVRPPACRTIPSYWPAKRKRDDFPIPRLKGAAQIRIARLRRQDVQEGTGDQGKDRRPDRDARVADSLGTLRRLTP